MKKSKTDSEIFASIKHSLESYEEEYLPGAWEGFVQLQKRGRRLRYLRIVSAVAACLLLGVIGTNYLFFNDLKVPKTDQPQIAAGKAEDYKSVTITEKESVTSTPVVRKSDLKPLVAPRIVSAVKSGQGKKTPAAQVSTLSINPLAFSVAKDTVRIASATKVDIAVVKSVPDTMKVISDTTGSKKIVKIPDTQLIAANQSNETAAKRKIRLGINLSPGVSSTQSASAFSYTGGVSADIPLFGNFQLSTGLQIENQTIVSKVGSMAASADASFGLPTVPSNQAQTKLVNLDLPLNITWKFIAEESHSYYVSAGLSSLVYLRQENKNTTYSQLLVPVSTVINGQDVKTYSLINQASVSQNTTTPDQIFDFAGRLNIILGVERKLSKRIFIHFEPYAKIPVAGMATENLRNTSTGINFKISY